MAVNSKIKRDGPGNLAFGETLRLKAIQGDTKTEQCVVTFDMYGSHIEVDMFPVDADDVVARINPDHSERSGFSKDENTYICAIATLVAGMFRGWFPERAQQVTVDELENF